MAYVTIKVNMVYADFQGEYGTCGQSRLIRYMWPVKANIVYVDSQG